MPRNKAVYITCPYCQEQLPVNPPEHIDGERDMTAQEGLRTLIAFNDIAKEAFDHENFYNGVYTLLHVAGLINEIMPEVAGHAGKCRSM